MKRLILLVVLVMAMAVLAPAAFADDANEEPDADDAVVEMGMEKDLSGAQEWKALMIADYFFNLTTATELADTTASESADDDLDDTLKGSVLALRSVTGWGAVFKLMMYAYATGEDVESIGPLGDDGGFGFGNLLRGLEFDGEYTNLGQLQKSYKEKPEKVMPEQSQKDKKDKKDKDKG